MVVKGHTAIELTDVNTGEVETYEHDNMVTNAIGDAFGCNPFGMLYRAVEQTITGTDIVLDAYLLPICPKGTAGILLFSESLEEDKDNTYPSSGNLPFAWASNDVNSSTDLARGSYNATESARLSNGYKYVWDFTTSQGNGTIAALALTNPLGGRGGMGNINSDDGVFKLIKTSQYAMSDYSERWYFYCIVELNIEENYAISLSYSNAKVWIRKLHVAATELGLLDGMDEGGYRIQEEDMLEPSVFSFSGSNGTFLDGGDGYWYGLRNTANSSGTATVYWIRISKSDHSFTEGTWTFASTFLAVLGTQNYSTSQYSITCQRNCCIRGGYLYALRYNRPGVYKISLSNTADITYIEFPAAGASSSISNCYLQVVNGIIFGTNFMILEDDTAVETKGTNSRLGSITTPAFRYKNYLVGWSPSDRCLFMIMPYLATINNLEHAVEKTADKTMKVTYTLTEQA